LGHRHPPGGGRDRLPIPEFGKGRSLPSVIRSLRFAPRCSRFRSVLRETLQADPPPFAANQNGDIRRLEWLAAARAPQAAKQPQMRPRRREPIIPIRSEEHTSELQSLTNLVCRLLLEKKKTHNKTTRYHRLQT